MAAKKKAENVEEMQEKDQGIQTEFTKEQILVSSRYRNRRDLIDALLYNEKKYTVKEVDQMIEKFMKGQVK